MVAWSQAHSYQKYRFTVAKVILYFDDLFWLFISFFVRDHIRLEIYAAAAGLIKVTLKNWTNYSRMDQVQFFKGCLPQILVGLFLNTFSQMILHPLVKDAVNLSFL